MGKRRLQQRNRRRHKLRNWRRLEQRRRRRHKQRNRRRLEQRSRRRHQQRNRRRLEQRSQKRLLTAGGCLRRLNARRTGRAQKPVVPPPTNRTTRSRTLVSVMSSKTVEASLASLQTVVPLWHRHPQKLGTVLREMLSIRMHRTSFDLTLLGGLPSVSSLTQIGRGSH